jgi:hypothetical protein
MRGQQVGRGVFGGGPASTAGRVVGDYGAIWVWNTATADFTERSRGFQGDVADLAVTDTDVYAAVNECSDVRCQTRRGTVMHRGTAGFEPLGTFPSNELVKAIVARSDTEVIVAAETSVFVWSGASWTTVPVGGLQGPILDLQWCGSSLWGAGEGGTIYSGNTTLLNTAGGIAAGPLTSIHCPTSMEIWVAGDQYLGSKTTNGTWTQRTSDSVAQAPWMAVWSPGVGEGFTFGDARFGVYFDTKDLLLQDATGPISIDVATAMWGNKIDNLYMTGLTTLPSVFGFMLRFDGINWSLVDSGASRKGTALIGPSNNEIWLGTEGGGVLKAVPPP